MDDQAKLFVAFAILALVVFFVTIGPIFTIWSINCLFGTEIVLTFKTWCAMAWIIMIVNGIKANVKKNNAE